MRTGNDWYVESPAKTGPPNLTGRHQGNFTQVLSREVAVEVQITMKKESEKKRMKNAAKSAYANNPAITQPLTAPGGKRQAHCAKRPTPLDASPAPCAPRFALRRGLGFWEVVFEGKTATVKHEQGLAYVAWLVSHPGESILALDLATQVNASEGRNKGVAELLNPITGEGVALQADSRIQERAPALDRARTMKAVLQRQHELEALVEQQNLHVAVKEEAYRELIKLYDYEKRNSTRARDAAGRASDAVGRAVKRLERKLAQARKANGTANTNMALFAKHIRDHILIPSGRSGRGGDQIGRVLKGILVYEAPTGVRWEVS